MDPCKQFNKITSSTHQRPSRNKLFGNGITSSMSNSPCSTFLQPCSHILFVQTSHLSPHRSLRPTRHLSAHPNRGSPHPFPESRDKLLFPTLRRHHDILSIADHHKTMRGDRGEVIV
ncbi:hypothetical protein BC829DRAFT_402123, partial [Chytridium lagenaria]